MKTIQARLLSNGRPVIPLGSPQIHGGSRYYRVLILYSPEEAIRARGDKCAHLQWVRHDHLGGLSGHQERAEAER